MCSPTAALGVLQTGANFIIQEEAVKAQTKFAEEQAQAVADATVDDAINKFSQLNRRSIEENTAASRQIQTISRQARLAGGSVRGAAGASGVEGSSVDALVRDFEAQELARIEITRDNLSSTQLSIQDQAEGVSAEAQQRLFNNTPNPIERPSIFNALFSIGASIAGGLESESSISPETGDRSLD